MLEKYDRIEETPKRQQRRKNMRIFGGIEQLLDIGELQAIQDDIAKATGLAIITVDYTGRPLTRHSCPSAFCTKVRMSKYGALCEKCDSHGGIEAARLHSPYIYFCHAGLVDFAIPFWADGQYLGAFMGGQVRLDPEQDTAELEAILPRTELPEQLQTAWEEVPLMNLDHVRALADMLMHFGTIYMQYTRYRYLALQAAGQPLRQAGLPRSKSPAPEQDDSARHRQALLAPAVKYIYLHTNEKITVGQMAALCGISGSYFSKLFVKEHLCSLAQYINRIRVEQGMELLRVGALSVREVSEKLGFEDCGYFIKVFKRFTGVTPLEYQKTHRI